MRWQFTFAVLLGAALSGCSYLNHECGSETRSVFSEGSAKANPTDSADAHLTLTQTRGENADQVFRWEICGILFRDRVISMTLMDQAGAVLFNFPPPQVSLPALSSGFAAETQGANLSGIYDALASGKAKVVIVIGPELFAPESGLTLTLPLQRITKDDWQTLYCR